MEDQQNKKLYPFKFIPTALRKVWGGRTLIDRYSKKFFEPTPDGDERQLTVDEKIGESFELSDLGYIDSVIQNGWFAGNTISDLMETYMDRVVGENSFYFYGKQFPVMVKFLDVRDRMAVHVNPDDDTAEQRYDAFGKTAMWYIVDADPGAKVFMGFKKDVSADEFFSKCKDGTLEDLMNVVQPRKGDSFLITPGLVHSAGGGVLIAEIAESSDLFFRLYDWGRERDAQTAREMHLEEAFDIIDFHRYDESHFLKGPLWKEEDHDECGCTEEHHHDPKIVDKLFSCPQFTVTRIRLSDALHIYAEKFESFIVYVCIEGEASVQVPSENEKGEKTMDNYIVSAGETVLVPSEVKDFFLVPRDRSTVLLEAMIEKREEKDEYINPDAPAYLPDEEYDHADDVDDEDEILDAEIAARQLAADHDDHCDCGHHHN